MSNFKFDYWQEALNVALEDIDKFDVLTDDEKKIVAESLVTSSECESMCYYTPSSRDIENSEITNLKKRIKELEQEVNTIRTDFKKNVAMRRGCDPSDVTLLDNGHAEYR